MGKRASAAGRFLTRAGALDRHPRVVEGVRRLRRTLPGDPGFGDPLSTAGRDGAARVARLADRLVDEQARASREAGMAALQVWQATLERTGRGRGDREMAIVFTDLVGFSNWALSAGDDDALLLLRTVATAVEPPLLAHRGRVVKRTGDGLMAVFPTAQLALDGVLAARDQLAGVEVAGHQPRLRAGLHCGRPRAVGGDYLGVDVNVAARLAEKAGTDEVLVSGPALAGLDRAQLNVRRKKSFRLVRVKGVPADLEVWAVTPQG